MGFDSKCHELALLFLEDDPSYDDYSAGEKKKYADALAQEIQDTIEQYLTFDLPKTHVEPETA